MRHAARALGFACIFHASRALAAGSAWTEEGYARVVHERDLVIVDGEVEHLVLQVRFQSDAKAHALVVPMPAQPLAEGGYSIEDELIFGRLEAIVRYDDPKLIPDALPVEMLPEASARSAQGTVMPDPSALADWLKLEGFPQRPTLLDWAKRTGGVLNAIKLEADDAQSPSRVTQSPALRFSFPAPRPSLPYTETPPSDADEARFVARRGKVVAGHALDVWIVAPTAMDLAPASNLEERATTRVSGAELEGAIGKLGDFDPRSRASWVISRYAERGKSARVAFQELAVVPGQMRAPANTTHATKRSHHKAAKGFLALAIGLLLVVALALRASAD